LQLLLISDTRHSFQEYWVTTLVMATHLAGSCTCACQLLAPKLVVTLLNIISTSFHTRCQKRRTYLNTRNGDLWLFTSRRTRHSQ